MNRTFPAAAASLYLGAFIAGFDPTGAVPDAVDRAIAHSWPIQIVDPLVQKVIAPPKHILMGFEPPQGRDEPPTPFPEGGTMRMITASASGTAVWDQFRWDDGSVWG